MSGLNLKPTSPSTATSFETHVAAPCSNGILIVVFFHAHGKSDSTGLNFEYDVELERFREKTKDGVVRYWC
jgi:hypothetical protein